MTPNKHLICVVIVIDCIHNFLSNDVESPYCLLNILRFFFDYNCCYIFTGGIFTSRQNEQIRHPTAKTNYSTRILADKIIVILLAVILIAGQMDNIAPYFFN